ncbi:hexose transporter hxt1 [Coelomomyces lativittatus]|nr:hexose transporter hxt1 [Coelomomyces lativittatus]
MKGGLFNPQSYVVASFVLGCIPGSMSMAVLAPSLGRKRSLWLGALMFMVGAVLQTTVASSSSPMSKLIHLCLGRGLSGIGNGMLSMSVPMYIAEISPTDIRGKLTSMFQLFIVVGIFMASVINAPLILLWNNNTETLWRWILALQMIPGVLMMLLLFFIPESPRWLFSRKKESEGWTALMTLRQATSEQVKAEYDSIHVSLQGAQLLGKASWTEMFGPVLRRRVFMAMALQFFQQWTGINAILYYSAGLYAQLKLDSPTASMYLLIFQNGVNMLATLPALYLIERLGRRGLLMWGGLGIAMSLIFAVICLQFYESSFTFSILSVMAIYLFLVVFACTWGPVVWVFQSEIFPQRAKDRASGLATATNWITNFLITLLYPSVRDLIGTFQLIPFLVMAVIMTLYVYFLVPETKGKTLEEMDHVFQSQTLLHDHEENPVLDPSTMNSKDI